ncbi:unknown [Coprococcus sp. CAG:782]|nr:unknown [Coprococcus sp. CAG:782]
MWNLRKLVCGEIRSIIEINKIVRDPKRGLLHLFAEAFFFKLYNDVYDIVMLQQPLAGGSTKCRRHILEW